MPKTSLNLLIYQRHSLSDLIKNWVFVPLAPDIVAPRMLVTTGANRNPAELVGLISTRNKALCPQGCGHVP
jgi:hypothetical protein